MEIISSVNNRLIKQFKKLSDKKTRAESGLYLIEGERLTNDALEAGAPIDYIFVDESHLARFEYFLSRAQKRAIDVFSVSETVIQTLCQTVSPQGIAAVLRQQEQVIDYSRQGLIVALDCVQDPGNAGTIIRTAEAAGVMGVILSEGSVDKYNPKLVRATMGGIFRLPVIETGSLATEMSALKNSGYVVYAAHLDGKDFYLREKTDPKAILIIGNEANGIRPEITAMADRLFKLPIQGKAESLNAAVAAGIAIYDLLYR